MNIPVSSNQFTKLTFEVGINPWEGGNLGSQGFDALADNFGAKGAMFGGISHFKSRTDYIISH